MPIVRCVLFAALMLVALPSVFAASNPASDQQDERCREMLKNQLAKPYPPDGCWHYEDFALAAYWLNERTAEADQAILAERKNDFVDTLKDEGDFHWHAYLLERIYFLFGHDSKHFPGRMSAEAEAALLDMLWRWAEPRCRLEMTLPERDWWQWGSENHHAQAWASFWGAAQIFAKHPDYKNRRYAAGTTPAQMTVAFNEYFKRFARERAGKGLLVECNSAYNKYTLGGWYNLADFADDPVLRQRMGMLLDLFWADWASEQINGVRGGSRHRCYPGMNSTEGSGMNGVAWFHFGLSKTTQHPSAMCAATTFWRPSSVVMELAFDVKGRGVYEYTSRRPGLEQTAKTSGLLANYTSDTNHPFYKPRGLTQFKPEGGGLLRYTWCTPDFVLGTSMVEARPTADWAGVSSQNRWEGVIFAGHPTARIFAQPLTPKRGSVYNANWSVQKRGVLIIQRLKTSNAKGQRIWFDASLKRVETNGWVFAEAPQAFAAVCVVDGRTAWEADSVEQHHEDKGRTDTGEWLKCVDEFSPVIIEVARKTDYTSFAAFQRAMLANSLRWEKHRLDYTSQLSRTTLTLFADYSRSPLVDGQPVNYASAKVYDSPFIQSNFGSGVVTIQKGGRKLTLDFNSTEPPSHPAVGLRFVPADVDWEHPVYASAFDDVAALKDWKLEGGKRMSIENGRLVLESEPSDGKISEALHNHLVCWLTNEMPADFLLEFKVRPQNRKQGLNIVFFNARGIHGESIFDPALKPRNGLFAQYHSGDLNNYHISYWAAERGTANVRKNAGFNLVATGKDLITVAPADVFQTVRLYKRGGTIRLMVDDLVAVAFDDDGKTFGKFWAHSGWIGLRQMAHTIRCEYDDLKVFPLKP